MDAAASWPDNPTEEMLQRSPVPARAGLNAAETAAVLFTYPRDFNLA